MSISIDWFSLGLVTLVTVLATVFILLIVSLAARMLDEVHIKGQTGQSAGKRLTQCAAGFFLLLTGVIVLFGLWLIIPYFH